MPSFPAGGIEIGGRGKHDVIRIRDPSDDEVGDPLLRKEPGEIVGFEVDAPEIGRPQAEITFLLPVKGPCYGRGRTKVNPRNAECPDNGTGVQEHPFRHGFRCSLWMKTYLIRYIEVGHLHLRDDAARTADVDRNPYGAIIGKVSECPTYIAPPYAGLNKEHRAIQIDPSCVVS